MMETNLMVDLIKQSNHTDIPFPNTTADRLFEEIVNEYPDKTAIIQDSRKVSYCELNEQANKLAHYLIKNGISHQDIIAIAMDRSIEAIVSMIGILKAGAAYVPIDTNLPMERIKMILEDCKAKVIIVKGKDIFNDLNESSLYNYDFIMQQKDEDCQIEKKHTINSLAYIIYTSGTTGRPKGVMLEHKGLVNLQLFSRDFLKINSKDNVLQFNNLSFDASVGEIYQALLNGATLYIISKDNINNFNSFVDYINSNKISVISMTPTYLEYIDPDSISVDSLKVITGGTKVSREFVEKWSRRFEYINEYGPTETTINASYWKEREHKITDSLSAIPIGKPIPNTKIYIMDGDEIITSNRSGEICIGGIGVARGYINNQLLTNEKFTYIPAEGNERIYKTGDKGRWNDTGNLEFLGRIDNQVKVRGYRIELDEIETYLMRIPDIKQSKVVLLEDSSNNKNIVGYFTGSKEIKETEIKAELSKYLPDYMIPNIIKQIDQMPLNLNGKIDIGKLPNPYYVSDLNDDDQYSYTERKMINIWQEVLGQSNITIESSFGELGGDSLKAIALVSKITSVFKKNISIKEIFSLDTIDNVLNYLADVQEVALVTEYPKIEKRKDDLYKPFPLTGIQLAYLIGRDNSYELGGISTNGYLEFQGKINVERFNSALNKLIARHDSLRTVIQDNGTQIVNESMEYHIECRDLSDYDEELIQECILDIRNKKSNLIMDPGIWPLFEIEAIRLPDEDTYFFVNVDPIICDDSSFKIVIKEMKKIYEDLNVQLPEIDITFRDYVIALDDMKGSQLYFKDEKYWKQKIADFPNAPQLPLMTDPGLIKVPEFGKHQFFLNKDEWVKLKEVSRSHGLTVSSILCGAYALILHNWSNQNRFALNLTVFNRLPFHRDMDKVVGDFTTLLLLDICFDNKNNNFWDNCLAFQDELLSALEHRHYDGLNVIREIARIKGIDNKAVMPVVFTSGLSDQQGDSFNDLVDFNALKYFSTRTSQVYLDNQVYEINDGLYITWDFVSQLFDEITILDMFNQYIEIIKQIARNDEEILSGLSTNDSEEYKKYDSTYESFKYLTLDQAFSSAALLYSDQIAVKHHDECITYKELEEKSNQIARYLVKEGVTAEDRIGIYGSREIGTIINILGVLKAGGTYIPVDPDYPQERIQYIISKSDCKLVLNPTLIHEISINNFSNDKFNSNSQLNQLAYTIFTSGSTGVPKGVKITHKAAFNTILDINNKYNINSSDRIIGISSLCFDLSVYDVFGSLISGAALILIDDQRDILGIRDTIENEEITVWNSVPAIMDMLLDSWQNKKTIESLRLVILSGDWIPLHLPEKIKRKFPCADVISMGGATEGSIWSIYYPIQSVDAGWKSIPYGYPLANQKMYVLNEELKRCPVNVAGEIFIGGMGVAEGYMNDEEKTKNAFIHHQEFGYIYKTGDFGIFRRDGYIEFLGRRDSQVKIRGYRVELGEIENRLESYKHIEKAVVIDWEDSKKEKRLIAFYISNCDLDFKSINDFISEKLPQYMLPSQYIRIEKVPLTHNGKVDRKTLEQMINKYDIAPVQRELIYAEDPIQECLVKIWEKVFSLKISIDDNYYELGGDSLKAIAIIAQVDEVLGYRIPIREFLRNNTIRRLSSFIEASKYTKSEFKITAAENKEYYPATSAQERMFALNNFGINKIVYHVPIALKICGEIDSGKLKNAIETVMFRHSILRTSFHIVNNKLMQKIHDKVSVDFNVQRISSYHQNDDRTIVSELCKKFIQPFKQEKAPLFRVQLIYINYSECYLLIDFDHLIADGVSQGIFINDLWDAYENKKLTDCLQFVDYSEFINTDKDLSKLEEQRKYWAQNLVKSKYPLNLITDMNRKNRNTYMGGNVYFEIDNMLTDKVYSFISTKKITLYTFMISAYVLMLYKFSNQNEITVGSAAVGRNDKETKDILGSFINTIVIKNSLNDAMSVDELFNDISNNVIGAFENSDYPFANIVKDLQIKHEQGRNPLFDTMFVLEDVREFEKERGIFSYKPVIFDLGVSKFDVTFTIIRTNAGLKGNIEYSSDIFYGETINRWKEYYLHLIYQLIEKPLEKLGEISLITEKDIIQINSFQGEKISLDKDDSVLKRIFWNVQVCPDNIAVRSDYGITTYKKLWENACDVKNLLLHYGVKKGDVIALLTHQSNNMVCAILGIWLAGACYLPIDKNYPDERIKFMLEDSQSKIVLSEDNIAKKFESDYHVLYLDAMGEMPDDDSIIHFPGFDCLSYMIYTSGTSGNPKGVMITHGALYNLCIWHIDYYRVSSTDIAAKYAGIGFDASVWELFPYLAAGSIIDIVPDNIRLDIQALNRFYEEHHVTTGFLPTEMFEQFIKLENNSLRLLLTGAGKLKYVQNQKYEIYNNYGPTEYTVVTTAFKINKMFENIPIGKPIYNTSVYIVDQNLRLRPIGLPGELCIAGAGISIGYYNNETLNSEKFIDNPFETGGKLYRTGDLARWLPDGNIEFLGRMDSQIKIRGYRVELGEIEAKLLQIDSVTAASVMLRDDRLVAFLVKEKEIADAAVENILRKQLPEYMVPNCFIEVSDIPLTANGKVDYNYLSGIRPKYASDDSSSGIDLTKTEKYIKHLWQEVLKVEILNVHDNFYTIGGDSIKASIILYRINNELKTDLTISDILEYDSISAISTIIDEQTSKEFEEADGIQLTNEIYPLSYAQERIYTILAAEDCTTAYNIPIGVIIDDKLNYDKLQKSLQILIDRHKILNAYIYRDDHGEAHQKVGSFETPKLEYIDKSDISITTESAGNIMSEFICHIDLEEPPYIKGLLVHFAHRSLLVFNIHHLIFDGLSTSIFINELIKLYKGEKLIPLSCTYFDYAKQNRKRNLSDSRKYWRKEYEGYNNYFTLIPDYQRPKERCFDGSKIEFSISVDMFNKIHQKARELQISVPTFFLGLYGILLNKVCNQADIVIGTVTSGRTSETANIIGMFVNTIAIRLFTDNEQKLASYFNTVKTKYIRGNKYSDYPLQLLVNDLDIERDLSRNPLFDTMFVFDQFDESEYTLVPFSSSESKFDLTLTIAEMDQTFYCSFEFNKLLFMESTIKNYVEYFLNILKIAIEMSDIRIGDISILTETEKNMLSVFSKGKKIQVPEMSVVSAIDNIVKTNCYSKAVACGNNEISYLELDKYSNALANDLIRRGIGPNDLVAIMMTESIEMIVGIIGIMKAGAGYVPILPDYPKERIDFIVKDSMINTMITDNVYEYENSEITNRIQLKCQLSDDYDCRPITRKYNNSDIAYVIYTSGTTGKPKGVKVSHKNLINLVYALNDIIYKEFKEPVNVSLLASFVFDGSIKQIFPALVFGHKLVIAKKDDKLDGKSLADFFTGKRIIISDCTPSHLKMILLGDEEYKFSRLPDIMCVGGEPLTMKVAADVLKKFNSSHTKIINLYGPTETTVDASYYFVDDDIQESIVPIGKPIPNSIIYILDENLRLCPIGAPGEIYIGGDGVSLGYMNLQNENDLKFIPDPFIDGKIIYKTGDLGKWNKTGNISFLGRIDRQTKIRGFRIELEEIENILSTYDGVDQAIVLAKEDDISGKILCAYIVADNLIDKQKLRVYMADKLPHYMIPSQFFIIDEIPLTISGKINKDALLNIKWINDEHSDDDSMNDLEKEVVKIWEDILNTSNIKLSDSFFLLGGDSLKAIQIASKMNKHGLSVSIKDILQSPSISALSEKVRYKKYPGKAEAVEGEYSLSPIQRKFFEDRYTPGCHFNQSLFLFNDSGFKPDIVLKVLKELNSIHDILRTRFTFKDQGVIQEILPGGEQCFNFEEYILLDESSIKLEQEIEHIIFYEQSQINIEESKLVRVSRIKTNTKDSLLWIISHLIVDSVSWGIILDDFIEIYNTYERNEELKIPVKTTSYKSWVSHLSSVSALGKLNNEIDFWITMLSKEYSHIKKNNNTGTRSYTDIKKHKLQLDTKYSKKLLLCTKDTNKLNIPELLISALSISCRSILSEDSNNVLLNLESHGREITEEEINVSRTVGWFTATFPVVIPTTEKDMNVHVKAVKNILRSIPEKGVGFGILKYLKEGDTADIIEKCQPEISFNYLGVNETLLKEGFTAVFGTAEEQSIKLREPYALNINAYLIDEILYIDVLYDYINLEAYINDFNDLFIKNIRYLIDLCINTRIIVPNDYKAAKGLSQEDLDKIYSIYNK